MKQTKVRRHYPTPDSSSKLIPSLRAIVARWSGVVLFAGACLTGCASGPEPAAPCSAYSSGVVLVIGVQANAPKPQIPDHLACSVRETVAAGKPVGIVAVDGKPWVEMPLQTIKIDANSDELRQQKIDAATSSIRGVAAALTPRNDGSDLWSGLMLATGEARKDPRSPVTTVVAIDSGYSDRGVLNFAAPGMTLASPSDVVDFQRSHQHISDQTFSGTEIVLSGVGYPAGPQPALNIAQTTSVKKIFVASLEAAGARIVIDEAPRTGPAPETSHRTAVIQPEPEPVLGATAPRATFPQGSSVSFSPDSANFVDETAARAALEPYAKWLGGDSSRKADVTGTTSSAGQKEALEKLSLARAEATRTILVALGARPEQISAIGLGYTASPPDTSPNGGLDPGKAALNRKVTITAH